MENNKNLSRENLEQMTTELLDELLHAELRREPANEQTVRMILQILREREATQLPKLTPESSKAWEDYQVHTERRKEKSVHIGGWILKVASVAAILLVLFVTIPQQVEADYFFGKIASWTDSVFRLFDPTGDDEAVEYVFETDNPGLQQVYDTLAELDITEPVVPRWLPEGYELIECKVQDASRKTKTTAIFANGESYISIKVDVYKEIANVEYQKDETNLEKIEMNGMAHNIMRNNEMWAAVWTKDNLECCIYVDCQKDVLIKILRSIYRTEAE